MNVRKRIHRGRIALQRWITTGRRLRELPCPSCRVTNVVVSRVGDEIECGVCGTHFFHR